MASTCFLFEILKLFIHVTLLVKKYISSTRYCPVWESLHVFIFLFIYNYILQYLNEFACYPHSSCSCKYIFNLSPKSCQGLKAYPRTGITGFPLLRIVRNCVKVTKQFALCISENVYVKLNTVGLICCLQFLNLLEY